MKSLIMVTRHAEAQFPDAEPVTVDSDGEGQAIVLTLEDGEMIVFDRRELQTALNEAA